jgi:ubiquinone/menaquinone biosynthesis C-methylase UbiE
MKYQLFIIYSIQLVNSLNLPKAWHNVSLRFKDKARNWFIDRAEKSGIPWKELSESYQEDTILGILQKNMKDVTSECIVDYPSYFKRPFHGYEDGNLNWKAAFEGEAATLNIAAGYWPTAGVEEAQRWMRKNTTQTIRDYYTAYNFENMMVTSTGSSYLDPRCALDIGCSIGMSTEFLQHEFPSTNIMGLDLSPYFLAVAKFRASKYNHNIEYVHENAEVMSFDDNLFSLITCNYLFHEVPIEATKTILKEIYRIIEDKGVISIIDLEPNVLREKESSFLTPFRRWMFEITEPHIYSYYENDMKELLSEAGFKNIVKSKNDPVNSVWLAQKT